jgi:hypothetical protein
MRSIKASGISIKAALILCITLSSCSQQLFRGYEYKGSSGAPDVHNELAVQQPSEPTDSVATSEADQPATKFSQNVLAAKEGLNGETIDPADPALHQMVMEEANRLAGEGKEINHRNLTKNLGQRLVEEGKIPAISPEQERKMTRLAARMDKKQKKQGKEIDWKNNSGLELFFMIMSIGGLVLGIIGVGIGWFVFIVFAGLWLYFKLVRD